MDYIRCSKKRFGRIQEIFNDAKNHNLELVRCKINRPKNDWNFLELLNQQEAEYNRRLNFEINKRGLRGILN